MNVDKLCEAFCREISVRSVPIGWAVQTPFDAMSGDALGFYVSRVPDSAKFRVEDDGTSIAFLEALGVNLKSGTRQAAFKSLLDEYGVSYDQKSGQLHTKPAGETDMPAASLRFMAMLLRLQDFSLLHPTTVGSTFREDARAAIEQRFSHEAKIRHEEIVSSQYSHFIADAVIEREHFHPVAVFYGTSDNKVNEALILWFEIQHAHRGGPKVALLLERPSPRGIAERTISRAINRLDTVAVFGGEQEAALQRIADCVESTRALH